MLLVAGLIAVLAATDVGSTLGDGIERAICEITGGDCETELADADDRCLLRSETSEASLSVKVKIIRVGTSSTLIRQGFSGGTSDATLINDAELSAELQRGVEATGPRRGPAGRRRRLREPLRRGGRRDRGRGRQRERRRGGA